MPEQLEYQHSVPSSRERAEPQLTVVTGNPGKRQSFERVCAPSVVWMMDLKIIELQHPSFAEIARHKAQSAWEQLRRPVVVEDGGICVPLLDGWPGVYSRPFLDTVGLEGMLKLVETPTPAEFRSAVAYADREGIRIWEGISSRGTLTNPGGSTRQEEWSALWSVFIPEGSGKRLSEMSSEERSRIRNPEAPIEQFGRWWQSREATPA